LTILVDTSAAVADLPHDLDEPWVLSVVTVGELEAGVLLPTSDQIRAARLGRLTALLEQTPVVPIDRNVAHQYGRLRAETGRKPHNDLWIAATALAHNFTLVTADEQQAALPLVRSKMVDP
jgi:predicted nucleic acid-binding protein